MYKNKNNNLYLHNYPSNLSNEIEINEPHIYNMFTMITNDYTTVTDYDESNGSFRGENYKSVIEIISGINLVNTVSPQDNEHIYNKLTEFITIVQSVERVAYYKQKYPYYKNYPIVLGDYFKVKYEPLIETSYKVYPYFLSLYELLFLKKLFKIYCENSLYLIPRIE
jgi:hypothetical protein